MWPATKSNSRGPLVTGGPGDEPGLFKVRGVLCGVTLSKIALVCVTEPCDWVRKLESLLNQSDSKPKPVATDTISSLSFPAFLSWFRVNAFCSYWFLAIAIFVLRGSPDYFGLRYSSERAPNSKLFYTDSNLSCFPVTNWVFSLANSFSFAQRSIAV